MAEMGTGSTAPYKAVSDSQRFTAPGFWVSATLLLILSGVACGYYLLSCVRAGEVGFPLDDAWIHQTYARNLGLNGEWAFLPGQPSAGSTSPLWTAILAVGYRLGLAPYWWSYLLGWLNLWGLSIIGMWVFNLLCPEYRSWRLVAGALLALEWHLVWAAVSGMETLIFATLALLVFGLLLVKEPPWFWLGALIGLSAWARPDGISLLGPALLAAWLTQTRWSARGKVMVRLGLGFVLLFAPYLFFNRSLSGAWWPNTFFAKQAEYAVELQTSLWSRLAEQGILPLVGAGALLLPGFLYMIVMAVQQRAWQTLLAALWVIGFLALYALRLPVSYQHGRYVMPVMPVYFIWGLSGVIKLVGCPAAHAGWRVIGRAWGLSIGVLLILFYFLGAAAYQRDVALIESEMVDTAQWLTRNTEPDSIVAAHDIGALGYFGERQLLDLAGLVSPEVIPFIRDEASLATYLDDQGADYLVTFPGWYPYLVSRASPMHVSQGEISPLLGGENMIVYRWKLSP